MSVQKFQQLSGGKSTAMAFQSGQLQLNKCCFFNHRLLLLSEFSLFTASFSEQQSHSLLMTM
jgi:hypothetical protein